VGGGQKKVTRTLTSNFKLLSQPKSRVKEEGSTPEQTNRGRRNVRRVISTLQEPELESRERGADGGEGRERAVLKRIGKKAERGRLRLTSQPLKKKKKRRRNMSFPF